MSERPLSAREPARAAAHEAGDETDSVTRPFRSLPSRLLKRILGLAVACAVLIASLQGWQLAQDENARQKALAAELAATHVPLLMVALWDVELDALDRQLQQLAARQAIRGVRLQAATGSRFEAGLLPDAAGSEADSSEAAGSGAADSQADSPGAGRPAAVPADTSATGAAPTGDYRQPPDARLAIPHPQGSATPLGELQIYYETATLRRAVLIAVGRSLLEVALLTTLIGLVVTRVLHTDLHRPLRQIAEHAARLRPDDTGPPLKLDRPARRWQDEIDQLAAGYATLQDSVRQHVGERDAAIRSLAAERDRLDLRVAERTAELQALNHHLALLSQISTRFINLSHESYAEQLRATLGELAGEVGADACGLAERGADGQWCWRFVWLDVSAGEYPDSAAALWREGDCFALPAATSVWELGQMRDWPARDCPRSLACRYQQGDTGRLLACRSALPPSATSVTPERVGAASRPAWQDQPALQKMTAELLFNLLERWHQMNALDATRRELYRLARSDALTGLANRRHFDEQKLVEAQRAQRQGGALAVLLIDIDHFKRYNDHYGHAAGDDCLQRVSRLLAQMFQRAGELPARLGGEEFAVLLPGAGRAEAFIAAERLRAAVDDQQWPHLAAPLGRLTLSVAVHQASDDEPEVSRWFDQLMRRADQALYAAKAEGRNVVVVDSSG